MFDCKVCQAKEDELLYLREQIKTLTDKVVELASRLIPQPPVYLEDGAQRNSWDGSPDYQMTNDDFGEPMILRKQ